MRRPGRFLVMEIVIFALAIGLAVIGHRLETTP